MMIGVRVIESVNISTGRILISISSDSNIPYSKEVPFTHLRPYVAALEGAPWSHDDPARVDHPQMLRCSEPGCNAPATHDDGTPSDPYLCCPCYCTCYDKYTHTHLYAGDDDISCNAPHSHETYLSENKLRLYWDRTRGIPDKARSGIESICYGKDIPNNVLDWVKKNLVRLRRAFESNTDGIPLLVKGEPVRVKLIRLMLNHNVVLCLNGDMVLNVTY